MSSRVIVKAGIITGDCGGKSWNERADGAQIWAVWRDTLGGEGAAHVANPVDPFAEVWPEIEALLRQDGGLQAKTVWEELNRRHAGRFSAGQLRSLQRRFLAWRVKSGPDCEVFFPRTHVPGQQGQSDLTDMRELDVVIAGEPFVHLLYHFVLTSSNWESVSICPSESFEALSAGMQTALWRLGGVPIEHRTDNLSAATHELAESRGRKFTERYRELTDH